MAFFAKPNNDTAKENDIEQNAKQELEVFKAIQQSGNFEIKPYDHPIDFEHSSLKKLKLGFSQKINVSSLVQHLPSVMAAGVMSKAYVVKFPAGYPHTLMQLSDGGFANPIIGLDGLSMKWASFHPIVI